MALDHGRQLGQLAAQEDGCQLRRKSTALAGAAERGDDAGGWDVYEGAELVPVRSVGRAPVECRRAATPCPAPVPLDRPSGEP